MLGILNHSVCIGNDTLQYIFLFQAKMPTQNQQCSFFLLHQFVEISFHSADPPNFSLVWNFNCNAEYIKTVFIIKHVKLCMFINTVSGAHFLNALVENVCWCVVLNIYQQSFLSLTLCLLTAIVKFMHKKQK